jgi:Flp pilus assembly protein TadG
VSRTKINGQKGAIAVEFAFVLPLLIVLLVGIMEFGLILYNQQVITNASREGTRAGIVARSPRLDLTAITSVVNNYTQAHLVTFGNATSAATVIDNSSGTSFGDDLAVTVTFDYDFLVLSKFINSLAGGLTLSAQTVMKYE